MSVTIKKIFKHGGSYAVHLPIRFVKNITTKEVLIEDGLNRVSIRPKTELDTIETEPLFADFIHALTLDILKHPKKLHDVKEVWDKEWDTLLKGVSSDGD